MRGGSAVGRFRRGGRKVAGVGSVRGRVVGWGSRGKRAEGMWQGTVQPSAGTLRQGSPSPALGGRGYYSRYCVGNNPASVAGRNLPPVPAKKYRSIDPNKSQDSERWGPPKEPRNGRERAGRAEGPQGRAGSAQARGGRCGARRARGAARGRLEGFCASWSRVSRWSRWRQERGRGFARCASRPEGWGGIV